MILNILSRLLTFLSNVSINKGNKLLFHRYDMISLVLFFVAIIFWLDPNLREYFNFLQIDFPWYKTVGAGLMALPVMVTIFQAVAYGKQYGTIWNFGDGYGNLFEDVVRFAAGCDYRTNKRRYIRTSLVIRMIIFTGGFVLCLL